MRSPVPVKGGSSIVPMRPGSQAWFLAGLVMLAGLAGYLWVGGGVIVVAVAAVTLMVALGPMQRFGLLHIGALLLALVGLRYVGGPFVAKLVMDQPLGSNLEQPLPSFVVVLFGTLGYVAAFWFAGATNVGRPLLIPIMSTKSLRRFSVSAAIVGLAANVSAALSLGSSRSHLHVASFFTSFLYLALIATIADSLLRSEGRRALNVWAWMLIAVEIASALVLNTRGGLMDTLLAVVLTSVVFRLRLRRRQVFQLALAAIALPLVVTPVFLAVRSVRGQLAWSQRIALTAKETLRVIEHPGRAIVLPGYGTGSGQQSASGYYLHYYGVRENVLERLSFVNHVDLLKSGADRTGNVGFNDLGASLYRTLPRFLAPGKPIDYGHGDWLYCQVHVRCILGSFATAPLIGDGYVAFGWLGALVYPLLFGFALLLVLKKASGWQLKQNIWGVYLFILVQNMFVEGGSAAYMQELLRTIPQVLVVIFALLLFVRTGSSRRLGRPLERRAAE